MEVTEYCPKCEATVIIIPSYKIGYTHWICSECGYIVDAYPEDDEIGE